MSLIITFKQTGSNLVAYLKEGDNASECLQGVMLLLLFVYITDFFEDDESPPQPSQESWARWVPRLSIDDLD